MKQELDEVRTLAATRSGVRLLCVFVFCSVANYLVARDIPEYLEIVHVGNVQIVVFYFLAWLVQRWLRPNRPELAVATEESISVQTKHQLNKERTGTECILDNSNNPGS